MFDEILEQILQLTDKLANSEQGSKFTQNIAKISARLYRNLIEEGMPPEVAGRIVAALVGRK